MRNPRLALSEPLFSYLTKKGKCRLLSEAINFDPNHFLDQYAPNIRLYFEFLEKVNPLRVEANLPKFSNVLKHFDRGKKQLLGIPLSPRLDHFLRATIVLPSVATATRLNASIFERYPSYKDCHLELAYYLYRLRIAIELAQLNDTAVLDLPQPELITNFPEYPMGPREDETTRLPQLPEIDPEDRLDLGFPVSKRLARFLFQHRKIKSPAEVFKIKLEEFKHFPLVGEKTVKEFQRLRTFLRGKKAAGSNTEPIVEANLDTMNLDVIIVKLLAKRGIYTPQALLDSPPEVLINELYRFSAPRLYDFLCRIRKYDRNYPLSDSEVTRLWGEFPIALSRTWKSWSHRISDKAILLQDYLKFEGKRNLAQLGNARKISRERSRQLCGYLVAAFMLDHTVFPGFFAVEQQWAFQRKSATLELWHEQCPEATEAELRTAHLLLKFIFPKWTR